MSSPSERSAYLVMDTESVPDGRLLGLVKYPNQGLSPEAAITRALADTKERTGSDFLGASFMYPVAVCVIAADEEFALKSITCLDAPQYRPAEIVRTFWSRLAATKNARLVTFNGRGFDLPLLELAAFRYGCNIRDYLANGNRDRYKTSYIDLMEWLNNYGACRHAGGLNLLSKMLGKPGKMEVAGNMVYTMFQQGKLQEINDYCMHDTLDTYFVFLRTRVLTGDLTLEQEGDLVQRARAFIQEKVAELPALRTYLDNWGDWQPWP